MILIVGLGRSGTSFIAECFKEAGVDPGGSWVPSSNAGWEHMPIHVFCLRLVQAGIRFPTCDEAGHLVKCGSLEKLRASAPRVVKTPLFLPLLELFAHSGGIERILYATRPIDAVIQSITAWELEPISWPYVRKGEKTAAVLQRALDYGDGVVARHEIPRVEIRFPQVLERGSQDFEVLATELVSVAGVSRKQAWWIIEKTSRPGKRKGRHD